MDMFSPEFAQQWVDYQDAAGNVAAPARRNDEPLSPSQQEALEALVERVNAARTIV